jgi:hypothetical protein
MEPRSNLNIALCDCGCRFRRAAYAFGQIPVRSTLVIVESKLAVRSQSPPEPQNSSNQSRSDRCGCARPVLGTSTGIQDATGTE